MSQGSDEGQRALLWSPTEESVCRSRMAGFARWAEKRFERDLSGFEVLHTWSVDQPDEFWRGVWEFFEVEASSTGARAFHDPVMPGARWFPGARLNYAENSLRWARSRPDDVAIVGEHETARAGAWTWTRLEAGVASLAQHLRKAGVRPGDRVAGVLPNIPETILALLATASVGAVWSVVNTDFGPAGVADRFAQIEPRVLLVVDGYEFAGSVRDMTGSYAALLTVLPTVEQLIVVDQLESSPVLPELPVGVTRLSDILAVPSDPSYEQLPFDHPLWILYSSGTTGKPKGIVHSHGGVTLEFLKALGLHAGLGPEDVAYYAVATTWMVWNMLAGILLTGARVITYDGSPTFGGPEKSFEIVARNRATFFGAGAGVLSMAQRAGVTPNVSMDFSALESILVTGSPLPDATWDWVYSSVSPTVRLGSDSGGTDVTSAFIGTNPYQPVYRGEIMGPYLGVDAQSWNAQGERVYGEVGELVITKPMPSMPVFFWGDEDGSRYRAAYFDMFPGAWRQGDWVTQLPEGPFVVHGRSDSTINRGGIRMGSADLTHVVDRVDGVAASMVIGAELAGGDYYMPLFVVPVPGTRVTDQLKQRIVDAIREQVSPRYVPDEIIEAPAVPRTRTGKLLEIPVKKLYQGADPSSLNRATAEDPEVLDWYAEAARRHANDVTTR
ncbi:acetoacetate--CoA ligase [Kocuria tytonicola]|uniref:acetoacetate--CoA ligase n=1 Tax=Kocuria tytonicola TaxID=2055946 RepID=UPI000EF85593|nr:acetoacetate--CoA ligase [Kocuria tytonicola]RLZ02693.1 acetoacetate--CoA ligase [Kocuria tytonicola]